MSCVLDSEVKISDELTTIADGVDVLDDRMASMLKSTFGLTLTVHVSIGLSTDALKTSSSEIRHLPIFSLITEDFSITASTQ